MRNKVVYTTSIILFKPQGSYYVHFTDKKTEVLDKRYIVSSYEDRNPYLKSVCLQNSVLYIPVEGFENWNSPGKLISFCSLEKTCSEKWSKGIIFEYTLQIDTG